MSDHKNAFAHVPGCTWHVPGFYVGSLADRYGAAIVEETYDRWVAQMTYNRGWPARVDKGHTMARFGANGVSYTYKDKPKPMHPLTPTLELLMKDVSRVVFTGLLASYDRFNCVVVNSYAPTSGLYPHRDGNYIPELGNTPTIASVSFGATRTFNLFPADPKTNKRIKGAPPVSVQLAHGDLFVMYGDCDSHYHHSIPEEHNASGSRISLTFRRHLPV